ncbi:hypothetical protein OIU77_027085 [Salix suchowensis]|uniref:Mitochondrial substrate carrier family protein n=1 Tax=Salix suchowensis TaxID=1278906 RepID=A0ABQ9BQL2_9ROSI|nr:hypothetical protein OIU77_027085 [Salix suchowensis]
MEGVPCDLADFVHDGHSPSIAENNKPDDIKSGTSSPEIFSTTELVSAVGQIWNLLDPRAVSETKDQKNVILNYLRGQERFLKRGTSSWNDSWEGKGLAAVGIGYKSDKVYGWMKELIPANNSIEGCISRDPTGPANNLASRTADCYSDSVKSKEVSLCDNGRVVTIGKSSSLSSDYFLGALQDFNANSSASRVSKFWDRTGIQIQSSACEKPQHALAKQEHAFAGAFAGICVSLCLHPIDTVKTIIQSCPAEQKSISCIGRSIVSERGVTGLYRGISSNIASSAPISAIYTFTYESVKGSLLPHFPKEHHSFAHCIAGGCASIATSFVFTPSERVKQQMQIGSHYNNCWSALSVIKFYTYESLKQSMLSSQNSSAQPNTLQTLVCGGLAGSTAALFTTPFDVVKTRLQTQVCECTELLLCGLM